MKCCCKLQVFSECVQVFLWEIVSVALSGHVNVMALAGVESGVVRIQTSGDICVGRLTSEVFNICSENYWGYTCWVPCIQSRHMMVDLPKVGKVWLWYKIDWVMESSTAMLSSLVTPRYLVLMSQWAEKFPCGMLRVKNHGWWFVMTYPE